MANCRWNVGCIVYWGVVIFSTIFLIVLHFQGQYVLPTDVYLSCECLLKVNFAIIIIFTVIAVAFTKSKVKDDVMPVFIFTMAVGLLLLCFYTLFLLETVSFPNMTDALDILRKRYAVDRRVISYIQMSQKCCGLRNYTDWQEILVNHDNTDSDRSEMRPKDPAMRAKYLLVPASCCKLIDHCGIHYPAPPINDQSILDDISKQIYTVGCYEFLKHNSHTVYESMRTYTCTAFLFVSLVTLVFAYYWWKGRVESPEPEGWPAPPMDIKAVVYDSQKENIIAYINPFMEPLQPGSAILPVENS